jgi:hypothetical protein
MNFHIILSISYQIFMVVLTVMSLTMIKHRAGLYLALAIASVPAAFLVREILFALYGIGYASKVFVGTGIFIGTLFNIAGAVMMLLAILQFGKWIVGTSGSLASQAGEASLPENIKFGSVMLYVTLFVGAILFYVSGLYVLHFYGVQGVGIALVILGAILLIVAVIYLIVMVYRVWQFTIHQSQRYQLKPSIESPGKAVGFLFIPFFNLYWMFIVYGKLPKDINAICVARGEAASIPDGLGIAVAVLSVMSLIPFVGYVTGIIANAIFLPVLLSQVIAKCKTMPV